MADSVMVVDTGLAITTNRLKGAGTEPVYGHWGTGATAPVAGNTALQTPGTESRVAGTSTQQTTSSTNDTYQVVVTLQCNATAKSITEFGLFDASTNGNLFLRGTFDAIAIVLGDKIEFTAKAQYNQ